jgi:bifunctional UDP-N-acetylglucosamine pyrophosphorylase/glucosamine-1-phosphate N-acetyltransferase/UDP-N-acetylglucosamine pyrophosphorylase
MEQLPIRAVVLAAGKGSRLKSDAAGLPKVMREVGGKPLLWYVLQELTFVPQQDTVLVVGYMQEKVRAAFPGFAFAEQAEQRGTGHAVMSAKQALEGFTGDVLVCYGDMPLLKRDNYGELLHIHRSNGNACTILAGERVSGDGVDYSGFGSVLIKQSGNTSNNADLPFDRIVEAKDLASQGIDPATVKYFCSGIMVFNKTALFDALDKLEPNNAQGELYLTDAPRKIANAGGKVGVLALSLGLRMLGVNTEAELAAVAAAVASR